MMNKIMNSILTIMGGILLTILIGMIGIQILTSKTHIENILKDTGYYKSAKDEISLKMEDYMTKEVYQEIVTEEQIKSDIKRVLNSFYDHKKIDIAELKKRITSNFELEIEVYLKEEGLEVNKDSVSILANKLSDIYVSNLFVLDEMNAVADIYHQAKTITIYATLGVLVMIGTIFFFLKKEYKPILFSTSAILLFLSIVLGNSIYYMNDPVSIFLNQIVFHIKVWNIVLGCIYFIVYGLLRFLFYKKVR